MQCNLTDSSIYFLAIVLKEAKTLPRFINLTDKDNHYYLSVDSSNSLAFNKRKPDASCTFEVINLPVGQISLKGANGKIVNLIYDPETPSGWYRCEGPRNGCPFDVIYLKDDQINLHSYTAPSFYMANYQHLLHQGLNAPPYADDHCLFTVSAAKEP